MLSFCRMAGPSKKARIEIKYWDAERFKHSTWVAPETADPAREGYTYPDFVVDALVNERLFLSRVLRDGQGDLESLEQCLYSERQENARLREELQEMKDNLQRHEYYMIRADEEVAGLERKVKKGMKRVQDCKEALHKARETLESDAESVRPVPLSETSVDGQSIVDRVLEVVLLADPDPAVGSAWRV